MLSAGELADLELHDLADHHRHRLTQHIGMLRGEHALNRFTGSQTPTFGHRGVSFSSNFAGTTIMSAAVAGHIPNPATSYTTTTDSTRLPDDCIRLPALRPSHECFGDIPPVALRT
jgi:hypothetical protein